MQEYCNGISRWESEGGAMTRVKSGFSLDLHGFRFIVVRNGMEVWTEGQCVDRRMVDVFTEHDLQMEAMWWLDEYNQI